ncbi:hypothetical protein [Alloscardovia omnicolens]|uniref:hypothetical protein n=2 Tax=Alloscardovia omnicolens TaxID=419015 RepID=UPI00254FEE89|nr:hypothetical protein [Alloscardovia omnicolens]MDK6644222.1 hypothetical protein [Alloscardovia omnicolens]MDK6663244.1 hypothetical protein [Alloscardovia omnicolens]MDK7747265.1 hypothetical protein [Alloscardovia omnicolens]
MSNPTKRTWIFFVALVISYGLLELLNDFLQKRSAPGTLMFLPFLILFLPIDSFLIPFIDGFMNGLCFWWLVVAIISALTVLWIYYGSNMVLFAWLYGGFALLGSAAGTALRHFIRARKQKK